MELNYFQDTDTLYIGLSEKPSVETEEISEDLLIDFGENGDPVGITLEHAREKFDLTELVTKDIPVKRIAVK